MHRQSRTTTLWLAAGLCLALAGEHAPGQTPRADSEENFRVYTDPPRLLLTKQRLRLVQRERERQSMRWQQFDALVAGGAPMPEPGLANALYYQVAGNAAAGRKAVDWALSDKVDPVADLRQLAIVFDWCGPLLTPAQSERLGAKIEQGISGGGADLERQNARALAAIAIADRLKDHGEAVLRSVIQEGWRDGVIKKIQAGEAGLPRDRIYAAAELLHVIRDNLSIDLRENLPAYFQQLPLDLIAGHYPAAFPGPDNDVFVPVYSRDGQPDLTEASMSRAAGLALVAFDSNAQETQYLQGWLLQDRFIMRDPRGSVYEFMWANPYQPGLSYSLLPLVFHNAATGHVFARTSWDEDAAWMGYFDGHLQLFADGKLETLRTGSVAKPLRIGDALLMSAPAAAADGMFRFKADAEAMFIMGLAPRARYDVEVDDQELAEKATDVGGTLVLAFPPQTEAGVRIRQRQ